MELKTVLQEKEVLQTDVQNTKVIVGTIKDENFSLEDQISLALGEQRRVDQMTIFYPSLSLA